MAESVEVGIADKSDFQKEGKWYFLSENSQWEIGSTTYSETDDLLVAILHPSIEKSRVVAILYSRDLVIMEHLIIIKWLGKLV